MNVKVPLQSLGNPRVFFSRLGYHVGRHNSYERRVGSGMFPRFHVYLNTQENETEVEISLHLDTRPHSYEGFRAHVGEYDTKIVQDELRRITEHL